MDKRSSHAKLCNAHSLEANHASVALRCSNFRLPSQNLAPWAFSQSFWSPKGMEKKPGEQGPEMVVWKRNTPVSYCVALLFFGAVSQGRSGRIWFRAEHVLSNAVRVGRIKKWQARQLSAQLSLSPAVSLFLWAVRAKLVSRCYLARRFTARLKSLLLTISYLLIVF